MYQFSKKSKINLTQAHEKLQLIAFEAIAIVDFTIIETHRSHERQTQLFEQGDSKVEYSKHNYLPSHAVDIAPYPIPKDWGESDKKELARFYYLAGIWKAVAHQNNIKLRWGGDWSGDGDFTDQTFDDLLHFELIGV